MSLLSDSSLPHSDSGIQGHFQCVVLLPGNHSLSGKFIGEREREIEREQELEQETRFSQDILEAKSGSCINHFCSYSWWYNSSHGPT